MGASSQDISDYNSNNVFAHNIEAPLLVDELSDTEYYIGYSKNTRYVNKANWRIKRIWKVGNVWNFGFPEGNQGFEFVWDERDSYTYYA
jgi:hypothetical protein